MTKAEQNNQAAPPANVPKRFQEETISKVMDKVKTFEETGDIMLPINYSVGNALRSAWLILQETVDKDKRPVLDVCTPTSIANALFEMILKGLNPVKKQCYFIAYGTELSCEPSYFGDQVEAKRVGKVKEFKEHAVYEGDVFVYEKNAETGRTRVIKHEQDIMNIDHEKVVGAYVITIYEDGSTDTLIMSMKQIRQAWAMGKGKGQLDVHKNFTDEMACKTVIGRVCKKITNNTDDATLFVGRDEEDRTAKQVTAAISQGANKKALSMSSPAPLKIQESKQPVGEAAPVETEVTTEEAPY